jgi:hypothetical protein
VITPYDPGEATVIGEQEGGERTTVAESGDAESDAVDEACGEGAAADIILDADGNVVDVICYERDVEVEAVDIDEVESAEAGNNTVLVIDGEADGVDVEGDVLISGNNAVVYGDGPDVSVIGGTLDVDKNNAIVRGVRILEDVEITKNDMQLAFCVIEGNLTITGNNTTLAECVVYGEVRIVGLNTVLVQNRFEGTDRIEGFNLTCNDNFRFDDEDDDREVDDSEVGKEIQCVDAEGSPDPQSEVIPFGDAGTDSASRDAGPG